LTKAKVRERAPRMWSAVVAMFWKYTKFMEFQLLEKSRWKLLDLEGGGEKIKDSLGHWIRSFYIIHFFIIIGGLLVIPLWKYLLQTIFFCFRSTRRSFQRISWLSWQICSCRKITTLKKLNISLRSVNYKKKNWMLYRLPVRKTCWALF
jgi:hypothetical protein